MTHRLRDARPRRAGFAEGDLYANPVPGWVHVGNGNGRERLAPRGR